MSLYKKTTMRAKQMSENLVRHYEDYNKYIEFQKTKTLNPVKREKWLGEEWRLKIDGFKKEFTKISSFLTNDKKCLCLGARTGQEVAALKELGINDVTGVDIVAHEPLVIEGDIHNLSFEDNTFDFVYTNILDHSIEPQKAISEIERVLKFDGIAFIQIQLDISQDEYTEYVVKNPFYDVVALFNISYCVHIANIDRNFAGMNFEMIFQKDKNLSNIQNNFGSIKDIKVPDNYLKIWDEINSDIQNKKLDENNIISIKKRNTILDGLKKRAYYLTRFAKEYEVQKICEVGTAQGWQFYSFCEYIENESEKEGSVFSCDIRDVRSDKYLGKFKSENFVLGDSSKLSNVENCSDIEMFYIDGSHDRDGVLRDMFNLQHCQIKTKKPVWVFDDFDTRFGCFQDIMHIAQFSKGFKVYKVGKTASDQPSHQLIALSGFNLGEQ